MEYTYYKNYPLLRKGNELYYGYLGDPYIIWMKIESTKEENSLKVADLIKVYRISTETNLPEQSVKRADLYDALDIGYAWLKQYNKK